MTARSVLRAATADDHARVDRLFSAFDLSDVAQYRLFLSAQAAAHLPIEEALDRFGAGKVLRDWPQRKRSALLERDLADLHAGVPDQVQPPHFSGPSSILGAVYVLEGSRLGGAVLKKQIPVGAPKRFLDADQAAGSWRNLLAMLDNLLYEATSLEAASQAARQVFRRFELAGLRYLETSAS